MSQYRETESEEMRAARSTYGSYTDDALIREGKLWADHFARDPFPSDELIALYEELQRRGLLRLRRKRGQD